MYEEGNTPYDWLRATMQHVNSQQTVIQQITVELQHMAKLQRDTVVQQQRLLQEIINLKQHVAAQDLRIRQLEAQTVASQ